MTIIDNGTASSRRSTMKLAFRLDDGGSRRVPGSAGHSDGDCVVRTMANATFKLDFYS